MLVLLLLDAQNGAEFLVFGFFGRGDFGLVGVGLMGFGMIEVPSVGKS